ncbi:hypothetical protein AVEN_221524-1 [Araneus ventricosus]|uniref:Uncharacterized protein n=1 Tax=Araneus ventricosus TaxID=182803 RepID=A0A4Y2U8X4_ARAVE|nr:hypothetical protein AVEN_221524-1 [Araneus ventricosus]
MGHRTEQVPQREVLIKTPPKGAGFESGARGLLFSGRDEKGKLSRALETAGDERTGPEKEEVERVKRKVRGKRRRRFLEGFLGRGQRRARARYSW